MPKLKHTLLIFWGSIGSLAVVTGIDLDLHQPGESLIIPELPNQTTAGVASGAVTPDGRPLLWKNRDRGGNEPMEFRYWDQGPIPFIGYTSNNNLLECYGGINLAGFGVANTDGHNFEGHGPHNDGRVMWDALSKCRTIDDFEALLDSADRVDENGRYGYNYLCIDAFGGAAVIEAGPFGHTRFDCRDNPDGFLVRANFAFTGNMFNLSDGMNGIHRYNRSYRKFKQAAEQGRLTAHYVLQEVARDLSSIDLDPYPLPYQGYYQDYPYGSVPNWAAICRSTTSATHVIQGVRPGERPDNAIIWAMIGPPLGGIATPLWVRAGGVPVEYDGPAGSRLNQRIIALRNWAYNNWGGVDTWKLVNPQRIGLWDYIIPLENFIIEKTHRFINSPTFSYDRLRPFQNEMAQQIADSLERWKPAYNVTEIATPIYQGTRVILRWGNVQYPQGGMMQNPRGFNIYRSETPFRRGYRPPRPLAFVETTEFIDLNPPPRGAYYQIEAVF